MAAKKTPDWIPMCHPLQLKGIDISFIWENVDNNYEIQIEAFVKTKGSTGVEMEALTAASATALTIYDLRSEEHTSELQSRGHLVCRLLLEKKKTNETQ